MVKFIVVDDDVKAIEHIEFLLGEVVREEMQILKFTKIDNELKREIKNVGERKIYILDIELQDKVSGINIARWIRDVDWDSQIIFTTNHEGMFESAHKNITEVYSFITKFHDFDRKFKNDIKTILKRKYDHLMFKYKSSNNIDLAIYFKYILYIYRETEDRKLVLVLDNKQTYTVNLSLREMMTMLDDRFVQCYRSCIVNKDRIQEKNYKDGYFVLDTGEKVFMLSKSFKKDLGDD